MVVIATVVVGVGGEGIVGHESIGGDIVGDICLTDGVEVCPKLVIVPEIGRPNRPWVLCAAVTPLQEDIAIVGEGFDGEFGVSGVTA